MVSLDRNQTLAIFGFSPPPDISTTVIVLGHQQLSVFYILTFRGWTIHAYFRYCLVRPIHDAVHDVPQWSLSEVTEADDQRNAAA
jgi:hypothetical protein